MRRRKEERKQKMLETVAFIIGLTIFLLVVGRVGYWETHYEMECKVVKVTTTETVFEDNVGHRWVVENTDYKLNKTYTVLFNTMGTDNRLDDEIVKISIDK